MMKTKYDEEIEKLERGTTRVDAKLKKLKIERGKATKPYDDEIDKIRRSLNYGYQEIHKLKHNREIWIRNQELQKNKDLFAKGMSFKDLILTGDGKFSDYQYFLKSGTEVMPILHFSVGEINSEDELRAKAKELLSKDEMEHLIRAFWGRYLEFALEIPVKAIRKLYQAGFTFRSFPSDIENVEFRETDETKDIRKARSRRTSSCPLSYARKPETVTAIPKEVSNEG